MEIKQYKPLALVFYLDGNGNRNALPLDDTQREAFKKTIEESKMVEIDGIVINSYDIKEIRPAEKTTDLEKYFYSRSWEERSVLTQRVKGITRDQKTNPLELYAELGTSKAISKMEAILEGWYRSLLPKDKEEEDSLYGKPKKPLTQEEREQILRNYQSIKSKLGK